MRRLTLSPKRKLSNWKTKQKSKERKNLEKQEQMEKVAIENFLHANYKFFVIIFPSQEMVCGWRKGGGGGCKFIIIKIEFKNVVLFVT